MREGAALLLLGGAVLAATLSPQAASAAQATTYFISPKGSDSATGLAGAPLRTFARAWQKVISGDTIVVADGTYSDASPPPGKSGLLAHPITVRAENPGGAKLDLLAFRGNSNLAFVGFRIAGEQQAVGIVSDGPGKPSHHLTFQQIGFSCAPDALNNGACFSLSDGTHHVLLEDSWGWGGGRYTVMCYGGPGGNPANTTCDNNTFRRLVLRMGPAKSSSGNPQAAITLYYASGNLLENVVAIDGLAASDTSNSAFYITAHAPPPGSSRNRYFGVVALNNQGVGLWLDCQRAVCSDLEVRDSVFWASSTHAVAIAGGTCTGVVIDHATLGASGGQGSGYLNYRCDGATLTNSAMQRNGGFGARQSPKGEGSTPIAHHNGYFGNRGGARTNLERGAGDLESDPRLLHITRIEASSPYKKAGTPGDIGANVVNRYQNGQPTSTPLWPWPFEDRLRAEMCADVTRGFCGSGKTLTRYVWEYLGNPIPAGIYP